VAWSTASPTTSTQASQTPTFYRNNWDAIEDFMLTEHYTFTSALSGSHILGVAGVMMEGTTTAIDNISATPGSGAVSFDTTLGAWKFCATGASGTGWKTIHNNLPTTRVQAVSLADETIPVGAYTFLSLGTEVYDSLGEFASGIFTAKDAGYFMVTASAMVSGTLEAITTIGLSGTSVNDSIALQVFTNPQSMSISTITYIASAATVGVYVLSSAAAIASGGATLTHLEIHRVS
jgi:hypothetical protein